MFLAKHFYIPFRFMCSLTFECQSAFKEWLWQRPYTLVEVQICHARKISNYQEDRHGFKGIAVSGGGAQEGRKKDPKGVPVSIME